jgi:serine protease Do
MENVIDQLQGIVIQIATPYVTGTGFYLAEADMIITNEHVVRDNREVIVDGKNFDRQLGEVCYLDIRYDLAFIRPPVNHNLGTALIGDTSGIKVGQSVIAMGHPFGLPFSATQGILSNLDHDVDGIRYLQHDAALNPGNSGGPLLTLDGTIIGINTFIIRDGQSIGFSLPSEYLSETLAEFKKRPACKAIRCASCSNIIFESDVTEAYCPSCGAVIQNISDIEPYEALGISKTIEDILEDLGYQVSLTRRGPNLWQIQRGSASIEISYHEKSGLIIGDASLCELPKSGNEKIYQYLLQQNHKLEGLSFSIKNRDVQLSLLTYDQYLNKTSGKTLLEKLFQKSDEYDNILVEEMGAHWKKTKTTYEEE